MKEQELRDVANCRICGKPFGSSGVPMFYRVRVKRFGVNLQAAQRQQGLAMMFGGHAQLAAVMGPDEDLAEMISETEFTVCEDCSTSDRRCVAALAECEDSES